MEKDLDYREVLALICRRLGLEPRCLDTGGQLVEVVARHGGHVIIADAGSVADVDGIAALRRVSNLPLLIVGGGPPEKYLEAGADYHLDKPFSPKLLRTSAQAALRRASAALPLARHRRVVGSMAFEPARRRLLVGRRRLSLTAREADLLEFLAMHAGQVISRAQIIEGAWGGVAEATDAAVVSTVYRLRLKLREARSTASVVTAPGRGYRLTLDPPPSDRVAGMADGSSARGGRHRAL